MTLNDEQYEGNTIENHICFKDFQELLYNNS